MYTITPAATPLAESTPRPYFQRRSTLNDLEPLTSCRPLGFLGPELLPSTMDFMKRRQEALGATYTIFHTIL